MSLMDTADGAFMSLAYDWAFSRPIRKVYYNLTVTSLSVAVALFVGTVELLQVLTPRIGLNGGIWDSIQTVSFSFLGYVIVGMFVVTWATSYLIWKTQRIEERWMVGATASEPAHRDTRP
jgi:high-affinity nickel-transport protein